MAKALIGYMNSDLRSPALAAENARLRARVGELEALAGRLSEENDRLAEAHAAASSRSRPRTSRRCSPPDGGWTVATARTRR